MHGSSGLAPLAGEGSMQSRLSDWYAESLRLSFFGITGWTQRSIIREIADVEPVLMTSQPLMQIHQEAGNLLDGYINVTQQAGRVDVVLSDQPTRNTMDPAAPGYTPLFRIGTFEKSIEMFDKISMKATSLVTSATRVAYAITLIRQTESVREAGACLHRFLPTVDFDPKNDVDLTFQVNRPTRDGKGRFINRLAKWESIQLTTLHIGVGPLPAVPSRPPVYAARIYVDVSTDAENTQPLNDLPELVVELRSYTLSIAENGDSR